MAISALNIVKRAQKTLLDETGVRWLEQELLDCLNDGQREIVMLKPNSYSAMQDLTLVSGSRQGGTTAISDCIKILDVTRNTNSTNKKAITQIKRSELNVTNPSWPNTTAVGEILHYMLSDDEPTVFYVYPPALATAKVEVIYSKSPAECTTSSNIVLPDIYQTSLYYYIMFRAHSKETEAASPERAQSFYTMFINSLAGRKAAEDALNSK